MANDGLPYQVPNKVGCLPACKLCGEHRPLLKAHILPEAMWPHRRAPQWGTTKIYSPDHPKKALIGVYDRTILCHTCERQFAQCDSYATNLLRWCETALDSSCLDYGRVEYALLKRFFLATLWRASVSSNPFYSGVSVGQRHEARLRELIVAGSPGDPDEYSVLLGTYNDREATAVVLPPISLRFRHMSAYRFFIAGFTFQIKVDQRPVPEELRPYVLQEGRPLAVRVGNWKMSSDRAIMLCLAAPSKGP